MALNATVGARILRVNHGGEHGAVQIYRAQIMMARWRAPDLLPFLTETLAHEIEHRHRFRTLMPSRDAKPCRMMWIWAVGGSGLGVLTGLAGREAILACTKVVEETVHRHLDHQIAWASGRDEDLRRAIAEIQVEERAHLDFAISRLGRPAPSFQRGLAALIEGLIWLSTRGDSLRLSRQLQSKPGIEGRP